METGQSLLVKALGYSPKLRIIDLFLLSPYFDFSKEELVRELGMSKQTLYRNFRDLEELGMVTGTRMIGRAKLYRVNGKNLFVKMLNEQLNKLSLEISEKERRRSEKPAALEAR
jgi:AcrR family transcriptional regulator